MESKVEALITLTTDFGTRDPYVAAMKGVILTICPAATVVDLTHEIAPHDVLEAAFFLAATAPHFPRNTIHVVVVDPEVGTERRPAAVQAGDQVFVCPDNGILTLFARRCPVREARAITNRRVALGRISATFHGRDIFAPAAAHLARGFPFADLGDRIEDLVELEIRQVTLRTDGTIEGEIIHIDRFGNAVTNIDRACLSNHKERTIQVGAQTLGEINRTYADVPVGKPLALFGSTDRLEIAIHAGNAAQTLGLRRGDKVKVVLS